MKKILFTSLVLLVFSRTTFAAWEFAGKELVGDYQVWLSGSKVRNQVSFSPEGQILLLEKRPQGVLRCYGKGEQQDQLLKVAMLCQNGRKFQQIIDFSQVQDLDFFQAPVYSTLYSQSFLMNFQKNL